MPYLDNAATTFPKPARVTEAVKNWLESGAASPGRGSHSFAKRSDDTVSEIRKNLARFFGVPHESRMIFCFSATDALNMAIKGFLDEGDHVLISSMEHNSVLRPLRGLEKRGFINLEIVPCDPQGRLDPDDVISRFTDKTRLVVVSHASNVTGTIQPVAKIGAAVRERGAYFLLDAAQTAGNLPIHMEEMEIDMLAFSGHKGLFGLQGSGGLALGSRIKSLRPWREGGTGINSLSETQPREWPDAFEAGTPNVPGILSMGEGLAFIESEGIDAIRKREMEHCAEIWKVLSSLKNVELYGPPPGEERTAVISFNIKGWEADDVGNVLTYNHDVHLRTGLQCSPLAHQTLDTHPEGTVRISPGYFTTQEDLKQALKAIKTIAEILVPF
jgi:cysteine desulfurase / selenocysteine lyase